MSININSIFAFLISEFFFLLMNLMKNVNYTEIAIFLFILHCSVLFDSNLIKNNMFKIRTFVINNLIIDNILFVSLFFLLTKNNKNLIEFNLAFQKYSIMKINLIYVLSFLELNKQEKIFFSSEQSIIKNERVIDLKIVTSIIGSYVNGPGV